MSEIMSKSAKQRMLKKLRDRFGESPFTSGQAVAYLDFADLPGQVAYAKANGGSASVSFGRLVGQIPEIEVVAVRQGAKLMRVRS